MRPPPRRGARDGGAPVTVPDGWRRRLDAGALAGLPFVVAAGAAAAFELNHALVSGAGAGGVAVVALAVTGAALGAARAAARLAGALGKYAGFRLLVGAVLGGWLAYVGLYALRPTSVVSWLPPLASLAVMAVVLVLAKARLQTRERLSAPFSMGILGAALLANPVFLVQLWFSEGPWVAATRSAYPSVLLVAPTVVLAAGGLRWSLGRWAGRREPPFLSPLEAAVLAGQALAATAASLAVALDAGIASPSWTWATGALAAVGIGVGAPVGLAALYLGAVAGILWGARAWSATSAVGQLGGAAVQTGLLYGGWGSGTFLLVRLATGL